jgi:hypothetical protein
MSTETPDPELTALAAKLAALQPAARRLDRDQLLFRAGQASVRRWHWLWPATSAGLALLASAMGLLAFRPTAPQVIEHVVVVRPEPAPAPPSATDEGPTSSDREIPLASGERERRFEPLSCYELEQVVSRWGVNGLPESSGARGGPDSEPQHPLGPSSTAEFLETLTR